MIIHTVAPALSQSLHAMLPPECYISEPLQKRRFIDVLYVPSVSTFSSVRAENVILPHVGPESRETSTGHACVPHILNRNHMVGLTLMIFG